MPGMGRQTFNFRLNDSGRQWAEALANEYGVTVTDVIRCSLAIAKMHHEDDLRATLRLLVDTRS